MAEPITKRKHIYLAGILLSLLGSVGLILLVEIGLRMSDYGYASDFLVKKKVNGREVYINNIFYTSKFFTPELIRTPTPLVVDRTKKENTIRIAIAGESAAVGDPDYSFGFARILKIMLQDEYPEMNFEIINTAITAINSHVILPIVKETSRKLEPDVFLIYMGNNEVIGPFGPNAAFSNYTANRNLIKLNVAVNSTQLGTLARNTGRALLGKEIPEQWDGMEMFLNYKVVPGDEILDAVHGNFRANLEEMCRVASRKSKVILSTVAVNLTDCPPFYSAIKAGIDPNAMAEINLRVKETENLILEGSYMQAKEKAIQILQMAPEHAGAHYLLAKAHLQLQQLEEAEKHFNLALDLDALKFRADNQLNTIIQDVYLGLEKNKNIDFIDMAHVMKDSADYNITGSRLFLEHVHFTFYGNYLMAYYFKQKIKQILDLPDGDYVQSGTDYYKSRLAYTPFEDYKIHREILMRMDRSPFAEQLFIQQAKSRLEDEIAAIKRDVPREDSYKNAISQSPNDWLIKYNYALYLLGISDERALDQLEIIGLLVPQNPTVNFNTGFWHENNGDFALAAKYYESALDIFPYYRDANKNLASIRLLDQNGKIHKAKINFTPDDLFEIYSKSAELSAANGNMIRAAELFEQAIFYKPDSYRAVHALSNIHLRNQNYYNAIELLNGYLPFDPTCSETNLKLAMANEVLKNYSRALEFYSKSFELDHDNLLLLNKIGQMQYLIGNYTDAIASFEKSISLNPSQKLEYALTNIGMAYSKLGESGKAIQFYKRALEVNPNEQTVLTALAEELKKQGS